MSEFTILILSESAPTLSVEIEASLEEAVSRMRAASELFPNDLYVLKEGSADVYFCKGGRPMEKIVT